MTQRLANVDTPLLPLETVASFQETWNGMVTVFCQLVEDAIEHHMNYASLVGSSRLLWMPFDTLQFGLADFETVRIRGTPVILKATQGRGFLWASRVTERVITTATACVRTYMDTTHHHLNAVDYMFLKNILVLQTRSILGTLALEPSGLPMFWNAEPCVLHEIVETNCVFLWVDGKMALFLTHAEWGNMKLAVCMGQHGALGRDSPLLQLDADCVRLILAICGGR